MGIIRLLLAVSVVIAHSGPLFGMTLVGPKLAVQAFFVISGFYMSLILNEKYSDSAKGNWLFYSNRFLRIYPIYWSVLLLTFSIFTVFFCIEYYMPTFFKSHFHTLSMMKLADLFSQLSFENLLFVILSNVSLFGMDLSYFMRFDLNHLSFVRDWTLYRPPPTTFYPIPQAWSLGIELAVYAIAPFIFRRSVALLFVVLIASTAARTAAYNAGLNFDPWDYRFFPFEVGMFVIGALLYRLYRGSAQLIRNPVVGYSSLAISLASVFCYQLVPTIEGSALGFRSQEMLFLIPFVLSIPGAFAISKMWKADRWLGELSYPIYACHLLVIMACNGHFGWQGTMPVVGSIAISIILTLALEIPIDRIRQARLSRANLNLSLASA